MTKYSIKPHNLTRSDNITSDPDENTITGLIQSTTHSYHVSSIHLPHSNSIRFSSILENTVQN